MKVYDSLTQIANVTSDSVRVYLKLFSVTDTNQFRLVKSKMSNIFKPNVRWALLRNAQIPPRAFLVVNPMFSKTWRRTRNRLLY